MTRSASANGVSVWSKILSLSFNLPGAAVALTCIALWEVYSQTLGKELGTIASTSQIAVALKVLLIQGPLLEQLTHTLQVSIVGWITACLLGLVLGTAIGLSRTVWTYTMASIDVLRSIPSISLISIALMIFGFSVKMELVIVIYVSQWPMLLATIGGMRFTPASLIDMSRTLQLSRQATLWKVILPSALPTLLVGMRLALTLSLALAVVAEMVGNPAGLGFGLVFSQQAVQPAQALAYLIVIGILGWGLNAAFVLAARRCFRRYGTII